MLHRGYLPGAGRERLLRGVGQFHVCDPWGTVLHQCGAGEEVAVTELDMTRIDAVRRQLPILSARRTDVYELRRL